MHFPRRRNAVTAALGLAAAVCAYFALRDSVWERWYLRKLRSGESVERIEAAKHLGDLRSARAVPVLISTLRGDSWGPAEEAACAALAKIGSAAIPSVLELLAEAEDEDGSDVCARALAEIGEPALPAIGDALRDRSPRLRKVAVTALGYWARRGKDVESLSRLLDALREEQDVFVLEEGLAAVASAIALRWDEEYPDSLKRRTVAAVARHVDAKSPDVRRAVARCLSAPFPDAVGPLRRLASDPVADVRVAACIALSNYGPTTAEALPELARAARDEDPSVRATATFAIGAIRTSPEIVRLLGLSLEDPISYVRCVAVAGLATAAAGGSTDARQLLEKAAESDFSHEVRKEAQRSIERLK